MHSQVEAVQLIADGTAPRVPQTEEGASYEGVQKKSKAKVRPSPREPRLAVSFSCLTLAVSRNPQPEPTGEDKLVLLIGRNLE